MAESEGKKKERRRRHYHIRREIDLDRTDEQAGRRGVHGDLLGGTGLLGFRRRPLVLASQQVRRRAQAQYHGSLNRGCRRRYRRAGR